MYIKDVVMDGFKCYTDKVIVKNLDSSFTAITGMNGSGKSNIIDAIVFALDLSSSKLMRVSSLKELINIHRKDCSVTLIFNNSDKSCSPSGYEDHDIIEVSRSLDFEAKSKYRINGHNCTKNTIEKLCKSIGITNDFIVMQGHITKILNMKNSELQSMIEEVAGTKSYNLEKVRAKELLEKKEEKLKEARGYLQKNINPFLTELMNEKEIYEKNKSISERRANLTIEFNELQNKLKVNQWCLKVAEIQELISEYVTENRELEDVEEKLNLINNEEAEVDLIEIKTKIDEEKLKIEEINSLNLENILETKLKEKTQITHSGNLKYNKAQLIEKEAILAKETCNGASMHKIEELEKLQRDFRRLEVEKEQLKIDLGNKNIRLLNKIDINSIENITQGFEQINSLVEDSQVSKKECDILEQDIQTIKSRLNYPIKDGVYGTVDENFEIKDPKHKEAIYTILGGRAKFVICKDDIIAAELLKTNDRKISCIPLNKITVFNSRPISGGLCALNAIRYPPEYKKAFEYIFNNFYIFEDKKEASKCCFSKKVVCVTLDGTVYDPKGTLTGGKISFKNEVIRKSEMIDKLRKVEFLRGKILDSSLLQELKHAREMLSRYKFVLGEIGSTREKISLLEKICNSKIDVRKELAEIRKDIVEATKEECMIDEQNRKASALDLKINELQKTIKYNEEILQGAYKRLDEYQSILRENELKNNSKRTSLRMVEGLELRKKNLIKSTVRLSGKITKAYSIINPNDVNNLEYDESLDFSEDTMNILRKFNVNENIFKYKRIYLAKEDLQKYQERIDYLKGELSIKCARSTMDPSNFEMLEKNLAAIKDIEGKIAKLENDKINIIKSITALSDLGTKENDKAFKHINTNLRKFFGYFIKTSEITISSDYEIQVTNDGFKKSLSELSGGQRSIIALCLIFSMLTYKPAPFYIFDEIDAALDLNYTQGIGEIIKNEFKNAQFIIVSLKNNMFENANRIYRVYIQDQKSKVCQIK